MHSIELGCAVLQVPKAKAKADKGKQAPEEREQAAAPAPEGSDAAAPEDKEPEDGMVSFSRPPESQFVPDAVKSGIYSGHESPAGHDHMAATMLSTLLPQSTHASWLLQAADASDAAANDTVPAEEYEEVTRTRKKTVRLPLTIGGPGLVMPGMGAEQLKVRCRRDCS